MAKNLAINEGGSFSSTATGDGLEGTSSGGGAGVAFASNSMNLDVGSGTNIYLGFGATISTTNLSYFGAALAVNETLTQPVIKAGAELSFAPKTMHFTTNIVVVLGIDNIVTQVGLGYHVEQLGLVKLSGHYSSYFDTENASFESDLGLRVGYACNF